VAATSLLLVAMLASCAPPEGDVAVVEADQAVFRERVYPILLRDCAFAGCHGNHERFFAVFGPGRARLDPKRTILEPPTETELALSYTRAVSMIDPDDRHGSLLLRKPIPVEQGGAGHRGDDVWGRSVYRTVDDARYATLEAWVMGSR